MTLDLDDTIAAVASAPGGGLRGIVRISGAGAVACLSQIFRAAEGTDLATKRSAACLSGRLRLSRELGEIGARLYLWPTERSYTRQPAAELHLPGSQPLLDDVLTSLCQAGARLARPGEFTLRAFLAGRLDLTQAEAVLGVIDAGGPEPLQTALAQLAGGLAEPLAALRERLLELLAHLEAGLDFVEEDIEFISPADLQAQLAAAAEDTAQLARRLRARGDSGELPRVVLVGKPNAGKSSLLNALAGRDAALVSAVAGTTRDYVACRLALAGQECLLVDTAGLDGAIERAGLAALAQQTTQRQRRQADLTILCLDASGSANVHDDRDETTTIRVWTKCDLAQPPASSALRTSSRTRMGLDELRRAIFTRLEQLRGETVVASTAARCRESLAQAAAALTRAHELASARAGEELMAAEIRAALDGLGQVAGAVYTDDVLDRVFSRFCIGK